MKFTIAISVYSNPGLWEWQAQGLLANAEHIDRVIRVFDGAWPSDSPQVALPFPEERLSQQPRDLCGISRTVNLGVRSVRVETARRISELISDTSTPAWSPVVHLDDDTLLHPGALAAIAEQMQPGRLVTPCVLRVDDRDGANPRHDPNLDLVPRLPHDRIKGCLWACYPDDFIAMNGWNEAMVQYGYQDAEFAARWSVHYGEPSVWPILAELATVIDPQPTTPKYQPSPWYKALNWTHLNEALRAEGKLLNLSIAPPVPSTGTRPR